MTKPAAGLPDFQETFEKWSEKELRAWAGFLLHNYRVMDAFWFLFLEQEQGQETACRYNEQVWRQVGKLAARDIVERFAITDRGLDGLNAVLRYYPWRILSDYVIERKPDEIRLTVPHCPAQEGRLRHGLGEYPCKAMHEGEFTAMCAEIDPRLRVRCVFAPPDAHPGDVFCAWQFTCRDEPD